MDGECGLPILIDLKSVCSRLLTDGWLQILKRGDSGFIDQS